MKLGLDVLSARAFTDLLPFCIAYVDEEGRYQYNNPAYEQLTGLTPAQLKGRRVSEVLGERAAETAGPFIHRALDGEQVTLTLEVFFHEHPSHIRVTLVPEPAGGFYSFIQDETERVHSERVLAIRERELRLVFDAAPFGIALTDPDGRLLSANRAWSEMIGYPLEQLVGRSIYDAGHADEVAGIIAEVERLKRGEVDTVKMDARVVRPDGRFMWVTGGMGAERDADGQVTNLVAAMHDITERHTIERTMHEQLSEHQRQVGQELHDAVGQPLTAVAMLAKSLRSRLEAKTLPEAATADTLVQLSAAAHAKVAALIKGIRPVDVDREGLRAALDQLAMSTQQLHGVRCTVECAEMVEVVDTDTATQLYRIAQEAVANGIKHGQARRIVIWLGHIDGRVVMRVHDDGLGLEPTSTPGTGMGRRIMERRAATIGAVLSLEEDEGTLLTVTLGGG